MFSICAHCWSQAHELRIAFVLAHKVSLKVGDGAQSVQDKMWGACGIYGVTGVLKT